MDRIFSYFSEHKEVIIEGIIIAVLGSVLTSLLLKAAGCIKNRLFPRRLTAPDKGAILLSSPKTPLNSCLGRKRLLRKVYKRVIRKRMLGEKRHIIITGQEGIGKTLFCHHIYTHLKTSNYYLGWIDCNGLQSVFDIIKSTFKDLRFYRKSKSNILEAFENLDRPCILFVDQNVPLDDLEALSSCNNVILIISGVLRKISFVDCLFELPPLSSDVIYQIFGNQFGKPIDEMDYGEQHDIKRMLDAYANGNPFLAIAFAEARPFYNNSWKEVFENLQKREYSNEEYLKCVLKQLYKINELNIYDSNALSKLSIISYTRFGKAVFTWLSISDDSVERLSNTYWITREDNILYPMNEVRRDVLAKVLTFEKNLQNTIVSLFCIAGFFQIYDSWKQ